MGGFVKIRRGIEEHLIAGAIGFFEFGVYATIHLQADYRTGVWTGSAPRLQASAPRGAKLRDIQRALKRLEEIAFIRVFHTQGKRGNYHVMLNKFESSSPALKGKRLNAFKSPNWKDLVFEDCADDDTDTDAENAPYQEEEVEEEKKKEARAENRSRPRASRVPSLEHSQAVEGFRLFAEEYPASRRPTGPEWNKALNLWLRLSETEQRDAIASLSKWMQVWSKDEPRFVPAMLKFLRLKRWQGTPPVDDGLKGERDARNRKATHGVNSQRGTDFAAGRTNLPEL